ncbi:hypothetical protein PI23P_00885 [Polaribacter irgensii 23-P]|uniref:Uncharacterized protein n=1 Tax=Polaribacter irgensii 23-P TaxID=313594 RepID=A4C2B4_9FLAO|nr:hypothetical protein [Polaribacter irgensii]EAR11715.1 hypothetical protein PI23P_00885 [Polaribacter irgensii 23-P]
MFALLKQGIEKKIGQQVLDRGDCELLANAILETLDIEISYNTIRRLFGLAPNVKPNRNTLNILAKFIGYKNYIHFTQTHLQKEQQNMSVVIYRAVYDANPVEIIKLVQKTKKSTEDFVGFLIILSRELLYNKQFAILNKVFELEELEYNSFSYSEILYLGNSIGLLLRNQPLKDNELLHNTNFLRCVYLTFVDYSTLNGYYKNWTKIIHKNTKSKELQVFTKAILTFRSFLNNKKITDPFENLAYSKTLHPILCSRLFSIKIVANKYDDLNAILNKYYQIHSGKKSLLLDYSFELLITAITTKNIVLMRYLIKTIDLNENELFYYQKHHLNLFYLMCVYYYKFTNDKNQQKKYLALFDFNYVRYSYEDYIKLLYNVFLYSEAKTTSLKEAIKNNYVLSNKSLKYPYFSETYLINYFVDTSLNSE